MEENYGSSNNNDLDGVVSDLNVLYTIKEFKMHVYGPKALCSGEYLHSYDPKVSRTLSVDQAKSFLENGFCIADGVVNNELLYSARKYIDQNYNNWMKISRRQDDWRIHLLLDFANLDKPVEHAPVLNVLLQSPEVLNIAADIMGSQVAGIFYNQIAYRTPLPKKMRSNLDYTPGAEYHIDGQANQYGTRFPDPWTVLIGIALVDIDTEDMGNFTVFPGTHASYKWYSYPDQKKSKSLPSFGEPHRVRLKAGSAVFVHCLLPHRGGKNILEAPDAERLGIEYDNLKNIPKATREMVIFRLRAKDINYEDPTRSQMILDNPLSEHQSLVNFVIENN